jgi:hypothetical protein
MAKVFIFLSSNRKHLIFATKRFDEIGLEISGRDKIGILNIRDPEKALEVLAQANSMSWEIGDEEDVNGFFPVIRK